MIQKINFKRDDIEALLGLDEQYQVADTKMPGLRIMVNPGGSRTFFLYRKVKGRPQRIKIGRFPDISVEQARNEAKRLNSLITLGGDPHEEKMAARLEVTFGQLFDHYYNDHAAKHTKRPADNKKMVEHHIFPVLGKQKISDITPDKIRTLHVQIGSQKCKACLRGEPCKDGASCKRGQAAANRVMHIVNAVFNFALKHEYFKGTNPCFGLTKFKVKSRDRFLNRDELAAFFEALKGEKPIFQDYFMMSLYTAARKSNMLAMKWADIDFNLSRWRVAEAETKNKDVNIIHLSPAALDVLKRRKKENAASKTPSMFVFPSKGKEGHLQDPKRAFGRVKDRMNVDDIRIHDLRRTLASYMAINGASLAVIGKALNHKSRAATEIYARLSQDPVKEAMDAATFLIGTKIK